MLNEMKSASGGKKILLSLLTISVVIGVGVVATRAYFSDVETSTGNTFTAGGLDLKVDNTCSYNGVTCPMPTGIITTWAATDLGAEHKFFYFTDIKPGDHGEDTVSLSVDNDAWLRLLIKNIVNDDVSCTEPEAVVEGAGCDGSGPTSGELRQNLLFTVWLDQGTTTGFQGKSDTGEGDNILNYSEPTLISERAINASGEVWNLADYGGLYLKGGETAYFGVSWRLPDTVGDEVQTDSMTGDMEFQVQQYRNNLTPTWSPTPTPT